MAKRQILPKLNFAQWYRDYMVSIDFAERPVSKWDKRAHNMQQKGIASSTYMDAFLATMNFDGVTTVLDVGCGNGVLALQIAPQVEHVYCLDYSRVMLNYVELNAREAGLDNISTIHLSKEDDWQGIVPQVDVLISSRSGLDADIENLFNKFQRFTKQHIYFSYLVGGRFDQPTIAKLLGIEQQGLPDYIHIMNVLYEMGIDPNLSYVVAPGRLESCDDEQSFLQQMQTQYGELNEAQIALLNDFYQQEKNHFSSDEYGMKWALINWAVPSI